MSEDYFIEFGDWWTSLNFPNFGKGGGRNALDILRFLKTTEYKEFIEDILETKYPDDIDWM